jgi:hypothetical protein
MKQVVAAILAMGMSLLAQAQLVAPGTRATLVVDYDYSAVGSKPDRYDPRDWNVSRKVSLTVQLVADKQLSLPSMHEPDAAQQADLTSKQEKGRSVEKTMMPMAGDMMRIVTKCGEDEACITREVQKYSGNLQMTPELQQAGEDIRAIGQAGPLRYQVWKVVTQGGSFAVEEVHNAQITDAGEGAALRYTRNETRRGSGPLLPPANGRSPANNPQLEVDSSRKDVVLSLPVPLGVAMVTRVLKSTVPGETSGTSQVPMSRAAGDFPLQTVAIPGGLHNATGTLTARAQGAESEGGTYTVRWRLTVQ